MSRRWDHTSGRLPTMALAAAALVAVACFGPDPTLTASGKGRPVVTVEFPTSVVSGSTNTAVVTVTNPGPGDMRLFVVAFSFVGPASGGQELPEPLIPIGRKKRNPAIAGVDPIPGAVSRDGVVFVFGALPAGETRVVFFDIVAPPEPGLVANSVTVYDGEDPERAAGARLQTTVVPGR